MIVSFTGHRLIGGYNYPNPTYNKVYKKTERLLKELNPELALSGFAIGYDQIAAYICHKLQIPFKAIIPFPNQELKWPEQAQKTYHKLLNLASEKIIVSPGPYSAHKLQIRNQYLVDNCDILITYFEGTDGGTKNCLEYAKSKNKEIIYINQ